jgi:hypothetical protein
LSLPRRSFSEGFAVPTRALSRFHVTSETFCNRAAVSKIGVA